MSNDTIIEQTELYTIALTTELGPSVPYPPALHQEGRNNGFVDLRIQPELIPLVPEAAGKPGLIKLLQELNSPHSPVISLGCENGLFEDELSDGRSVKYIGGYIDIAFRDVSLATTEKLTALSKALIAQQKPTNQEWTRYELIIQPMRHFFGNPGFNLSFKILAYGLTEKDARQNFDLRCARAAESFQTIRTQD